MKKQQPSILNDVIGPVMRGPSSSHVAAAARIGEMVRQAVDGQIQKVVCDFDVNGSLAESHEGHGTDMGFACGLMGLPLTDSRVDQYRTLITECGIDLEYRILDYGAEHPNYYRITVTSPHGKSVALDAISTGGGMIEVVMLDGFSVSMAGDYYEICCVTDTPLDDSDRLALQLREEIASFEAVTVSVRHDVSCVDMKCSAPLTEGEKTRLRQLWNIWEMFSFAPVLPTHSKADCQVPFTCAQEMLEYNRDRGLHMWELAAIYEAARGATTPKIVLEKMSELVEIMCRARDTGLAGTAYTDRILHAQAKSVADCRERLIPGDVMNRAIQNITAIMEAKSSMNVIIAAPTAGACACLPGTLLALEEALDLPREKTVKGMLAAGLLGIFFTGRATFAAEVGGCQMECGAASGMAAAGACQMMDGTAEECVNAASMALQGLTGLVCDPVANRVEVPCLNKNVVAGMSALASVNMTLAGFDPVIPLDETIDAMYDIGTKLPGELRCTWGGLGKTPASMELRAKLEAGRNGCAQCGGCR